MLQTIHNFEEWVKAALERGLHGPTQLQGFSNHHFVDDSGKSVAAWDGAAGHGTVPATPSPAPTIESAPAERAPGTPEESSTDVENHS